MQRNDDGPLQELERHGWWPIEYSKLYVRYDAMAYAEEIPQPPKPAPKPPATIEWE